MVKSRKVFTRLSVKYEVDVLCVLCCVVKERENGFSRLAAVNVIKETN